MPALKSDFEILSVCSMRKPYVTFDFFFDRVDKHIKIFGDKMNKT